MVPFSPHTVTAYQVEDSTDSLTLRAGVPGDSSGTSVRGLMQPLDPALAYERTGLELRRPYEFTCALASESAFAVGGRVVWGTRIFCVKTMRRAEAGVVDHLRVILDEPEIARA